jgi:hypothetical protein
VEVASGADGPRIGVPRTSWRILRSNEVDEDEDDDDGAEDDVGTP